METETKIVHNLSWHEFEDFVKNTYGVDQYDFVQSEEVNNDSCTPYQDIMKCKLEEWDEKRVSNFVKADGNITFIAITLLQDMVNKDVLPEGTFMIDVCW